MRLTIKIKEKGRWANVTSRHPGYLDITPEDFSQFIGIECVIEYKHPRQPIYAVGLKAMLGESWTEGKNVIFMDQMPRFWALERLNFGLSPEDQHENAVERRLICETEGVDPIEIESILQSQPDLYGAVEDIVVQA